MHILYDAVSLAQILSVAHIDDMGPKRGRLIMPADAFPITTNSRLNSSKPSEKTPAHKYMAQIIKA
jgi:hypothetical protein